MDEDRRIELEQGLLLFEPRRLGARVQSRARHIRISTVLKQASYSVRLVEHVARVIAEALASGARFRVFESGLSSITSKPATDYRIKCRHR